MKVTTVFVSVNARDFSVQAAWWAMLLGRPHDDEPTPSCREWTLREGVEFQVLDNAGGGVTAVSFGVKELDREVHRLRAAGIAVPDPVPVEGFETLRLAAFADPEGNPVSLLEGS